MNYEGNPVYVGTQWGDEGKGKATNCSDTLAFARGQGGNNAGHTYVKDRKEINTHLLPSGITKSGKLNIIGHGTYVDLDSLTLEIQEIQSFGYKVDATNLALSSMAHVIQPRHVELDKLRESNSAGQGSTKRGIAYVAADKMQREGLRIADLLGMSQKEVANWAYSGLRNWVIYEQNEDSPLLCQPATKNQATERANNLIRSLEFLKPFVTHTPSLVQRIIRQGDDISLEGAQAFGLDIDRGTYPYVTSSSTLAMGIASGIGLNHKQIGTVFGIAKAVQSKVGGRKMITAENHQYAAEVLRGKKGDVDAEYGKSTGRPRSVGYIDLVILKEAAEANAIDQFMVNKIDVLQRIYGLRSIGREHGLLKACVAYNLDGKEIHRLPENINDVDRCEPIYEYFDSFSQNIYGETNEKNLPKSLLQMIKFCEDYVGAPFSMLGTGPENHHLINR